MHISDLNRTHRTAFQSFLKGLNRETSRNYTHFGYEINGQRATEQVFQDIKTGRTKAFIIFDAAKIVGFGHLDSFDKKEKEKRHVLRLGIVLSPKYQGKGIGKKLLDHMIGEARHMRIEKIWLATYADNPRALRLYRSRGFVKEGVFRKEEKVGNNYRDIVSMALFIRRRRGK